MPDVNSYRHAAHALAQHYVVPPGHYAYRVLYASSGIAAHAAQLAHDQRLYADGQPGT